jgi:4'-phosphopantetheinyl transferase
MQPPLKDQIHLCIIDDVTPNALRHNSLSEVERAHYERILAPRIKRQYLQTRLALRQALSCYAPSVSPEQWQFTRNAHGRPALQAPTLAFGLDFNISHTRDALVIAFVAQGEVGVDVEYTPRECRALALAQRYFSPSELKDLHSLELAQQRLRFFELWTLKEAYIKACGLGLAIPLSSFSFSFAGNSAAIAFDERRQDNPLNWQFWQWQMSPSHRLAIAFKSDSVSPQMTVQGFRLGVEGVMVPQALSGLD